MASRLALFVLVTSLAVAVAGCGDSGDGDEQSSAEGWADEVCSTVGAWTAAVEDAQTTLSDAASLSAPDIQETVDSVAGATETFVAELGDVGAPDTEAGDEAQAELSTLSDELQSQADVIEQASDEGSDSLNDLMAEVSTVTGALSAMMTAAQSTLDDVRQLDGAEELESAFESAPSCQDLQASGG